MENENRSAKEELDQTETTQLQEAELESISGGQHVDPLLPAV